MLCSPQLCSYHQEAAQQGNTVLAQTRSCPAHEGRFCTASFIAPYRTSSYCPEKAVGSCKGKLPALLSAHTQLFMDIYYITLEMSDIYLYRQTVKSPRLSTCQARHSQISV